MAAFNVLTLGKIASLVDQTAIAWENRNYWLKADIFRKEWAWVSEYKKDLEQALQANNFELIVTIMIAILGNKQKSYTGSRITLREPWQGAWKELQSRKIKGVI